jgi:hypothetical protein
MNRRIGAPSGEWTMTSAGRTTAGTRLKAILDGQPFDLMNEESKKAPVDNLNRLLRDKLHGFGKAYPTLARATCDVVFCLDDLRIWMETKLVHTHNGGNQEEWRFEDRNGNFSKYLRLAVRDVRDRLPTLDGHPETDRIAFLMVAYFSPRYPLDRHILTFEQKGGLRCWTREILIDQPDPRPRAQVERARISVLYWERATTAKAS